MYELWLMLKYWIIRNNTTNIERIKYLKDWISVIRICFKENFLREITSKKMFPSNGKNVVRPWSRDAYYIERVWWPWTESNMDAAWFELASKKVMNES